MVDPALYLIMETQLISIELVSGQLLLLLPLLGVSPVSLEQIGNLIWANGRAQY